MSEKVVPVYQLINLRLTNEKQEIKFDNRFIRTLSIPEEYGLEFELYHGDNKFGTSKNGVLNLESIKKSIREMTEQKFFECLDNNEKGIKKDEMITDYGDICINVTNLSDYPLVKALKELNHSDKIGCNLIHDISISIKLLSSVTLCENNTTVQLIAKNYNILRQKETYPFGLISAWRFFQKN